MSDTQYTYAVARIRAMEVSLFSQAVIDQLMACRTEQQCLQFLTERGWGDSDTPMNAEAILSREKEKIWELDEEKCVECGICAGACPKKAIEMKV